MIISFQLRRLFENSEFVPAASTRNHQDHTIFQSDFLAKNNLNTLPTPRQVHAFVVSVSTMEPPPEFDLYEALQLQRTATAQEVRESYRRLALAHHPDKNPGDELATARFQRVSFSSSHFFVCLLALHLAIREDTNFFLTSRLVWLTKLFPTQPSGQDTTVESSVDWHRRATLSPQVPPPNSAIPRPPKMTMIWKRMMTVDMPSSALKIVLEEHSLDPQILRSKWP